MRSLLLDLTTSLDGFIADSDEGIDWIQPPPDEIPADYLALMDSVDTLVMGRATYELSLRIPGGTDVFEGKTVYVFTSRTDLERHEGVELVDDDAVPFVEGLKREPGGTIWLFGGGRLATALCSAGLIDDYLLVVQPVLLGDGIRLWQDGLGVHDLELAYAREWSGGLVELRYRPAGREPAP
jgi:dihydrofolate reductase